jgi:hypothetical protein
MCLRDQAGRVPGVTLSQRLNPTVNLLAQSIPAKAWRWISFSSGWPQAVDPSVELVGFCFRWRMFHPHR